MLAAGRGRHRLHSRLPTFGRYEIPRGRPARLGFYRAKTGGSRPWRMVLAHHAGGPGGHDSAQSQRMEGSLSWDARVPGNTPPVARHLRKRKRRQAMTKIGSVLIRLL